MPPVAKYAYFSSAQGVNDSHHVDFDEIQINLNINFFLFSALFLE